MSLNSSHQNEFCNFPETNFVSTVLFITYLFLLPVFLFILFVGVQRWRKHRSSSAATALSHSDVFTYNMAALELVGITGSCFYNSGTYTNHPVIKEVGIYMFTTSTPGQTLFHVLTCVDRYLAVVYPITYLGLRQRGGVRIRNASAACVWLNCLGLIITVTLLDVPYNLINFFFFALSSVIVSFCSISVLCVLIRPKPGEGVGDRGGVDQSKQRAFNTMMVVTGVLLLRFFASLVSSVLNVSSLPDFDKCLVTVSFVWFQVPSSLVLPLLFLHRVGKLGGCKKKPVRAA